MYGIDELSKNGFKGKCFNGLDVQYISVCHCDIHSLRKLFVVGMKILSINVHPCNVRKSFEITPYSKIPGMNGLVP